MNESRHTETNSANQDSMSTRQAHDAWLLNSIQLASAGDLANAEASVRSLLAEYPSSLPARLHLARVLLALNHPVSAVSELEPFLTGHFQQPIEEFQITLLAAEAALRADQLMKAESWGRRAMILAPHHAQAMFVVAMVCQQTQRSVEALNLLQRGLRLEPGAIHALVNKGLIEKQLGQFDTALQSFNQALALNPAIAPAYYSIGLIHLLRVEHDAAEQAFRRALQLNPQHTQAAIQLATLLRYVNKLDEAAKVYRAILLHTPDNATARFHLDSMTQELDPARVPADVVRAIYADKSVGRNLEASLGHHLQYRTPTILQAALEEFHGAERKSLEILDLGCGSGLYGTLVKPRAKKLTGVDLSVAMIEECRQKSVYDELHAQDIVDYLTEAKNKYDLIVAMDVLCYFGDLRTLMQLCSDALFSGGVLACSVERSLDEQPWQFHRYGHFLHSAAHLREAATHAGLHEVRITESVLRHEFGEDRPGYVALFALAS